MKFTFCGCSFTAGTGLYDNESNYATIVSKYFDAEVKNVATAGYGNYEIFMSVLKELLYFDSDKIFVQWSALNRLHLYPSPDTRVFLSHTVDHGFAYRGINFSQKELQKFSDMYHLLNDDYHNLITLINYSNILSKTAQFKNTEIIFINGLVPWTKEISNINTKNNYSLFLSQYTKEILDFDTRDDVEIEQFFNKLNLEVNSLDHTRWPNIFNSMLDEMIDLGNDNLHPGPASHQKYGSMLINYLESNNKFDLYSNHKCTRMRN
jgi:hypothetical protein